MLYVADFETVNKIDDCRVWAYGIMQIDNTDNFIYGKTVSECIDYFRRSKSINTAYYHNLAFDADFIMCHLFASGFTHVENKDDMMDNTFTTLISDKGQFYTMTICFKVNKHKPCKLILIDSFKIIPMSVEKIGKAFGLKEQKLEIDYYKDRPIGYEMTPEEVEYLRHDLLIPATALKTLFNQGLDKITLGSNALKDYQTIIGKDQFEKLFPVLDYETDQNMRKDGYRGGYCFLKESEKNKDQERGLVYDYNSLYPSVMYFDPMPIGQPLAFDGQYQSSAEYPLYVQMIRCNFKIKKNHLPTIQLKNNCFFNPTDYLTDTDGNDTVLTLTNIDLALFFSHYTVTDLEYLGGWKFQSANDLFKGYIDKWMGIKVNSKKSGNKALYTLAKFMLNSLYGKFALNPNVQSNIPYYQDGMIKFNKSEKKIRKSIYLPVGMFITSYARYKTITAAQKLYDRFIYADTDSLHIKGLEIPDLDIDKSALGKWKLEMIFSKARYVRPKTYIEYGREPEEDEEKWKITAAGMPEKCHEQVTFEKFHSGSRFSGKLLQKHVRGGIVLLDTDFTIRV